ncbi:MAG: inositol monophosphatase family protein [Pseudomonadota bacterium]
MKNELEQLTAVACQLADLARAEAVPRFRQPVALERKADRSPVTEADRGAEAAMRDYLASVLPSHGIVGEEFGNERADASHVWILDPIDGTKAFICGRPLWGTLVGLLRDGEPWLGVIDLGALDARYVGRPDTGTTLNGAPSRTSSVASLAEARLGATTPDMFEGTCERAFNELGKAVWFRIFGGDCGAYGSVAEGRLELVVEADLKPYDYLPLVPVVTGAGGVMTDWQGRTLRLDHTTHQVLASANESLHAAALDFLRPAAA